MAPRPKQFREFCAAAAERRQAGDREERKAYWARLLGKSLPDWTPPAAAPRTADICYEAGNHGIVLDAALRAALVRRGAAASSTLFQTLLCGYFVLLHRLSSQERILIGIDAANRPAPGDDGVIGCCNAVVPIVLDFTDTPTVAQLQERLRDTVLHAIEHSDYTMTMWAEDQRITFDLARPFKVTASMNMQRFPARLGGLTPRFDLEAHSVSQSPFGLALEVRDLDSSVRIDFVYNSQVFAADTIERLAGYYLRLLDAMALDAAVDILALPMLPEAETRKLLGWSRVPQPPAPFAPFLSRFAAQAAATPLAQAVACPQSQLSYRDLDACSDHIARAIIDRGLRPGTPVALLADRGCSYLAALLAILKAGCVYLPLDPKAPDARLREQIAQGDAGLVLHGSAHRDAAAALPGAGRALPMLCVDTLFAGAPDAIPGPEPQDAAPDAPAYVLFTSGSSGRPKAAVVSHGGMMNHLQAKIDALDLKPDDVVGQTASQCFDISVWQYLAPLLAGGCVRVLDDSITHDPRCAFHRNGPAEHHGAADRSVGAVRRAGHHDSAGTTGADGGAALADFDRRSAARRALPQMDQSLPARSGHERLWADGMLRRRDPSQRGMAPAGRDDPHADRSSDSRRRAVRAQQGAGIRPLPVRRANCSSAGGASGLAISTIRSAPRRRSCPIHSPDGRTRGCTGPAIWSASSTTARSITSGGSTSRSRSTACASNRARSSWRSSAIRRCSNAWSRPGTVRTARARSWPMWCCVPASPYPPGR